ncbi:TlpA family protein disulfide reductase [Paenibacillus sp. GCM10027627]|uniref:TlpA family protein disulfide reductase n=1 Tax=unclassified Paenibacillus TaxID=185978 RepID=UPI003635934D
MGNWQLGTLVLNTELLVYLAAGLAGVLAIRFCNKSKEGRQQDVAIAWSAALLWIAVWKGSLLLIDPIGVFKQPMSLVFFSGGTVGFWLAAIAALAYAGYRLFRLYGLQGAARRLGIMISAWSIVYLFSIIAFSGHAGLLHSMGLFGAMAGWAAFHRPETFGLTNQEGWSPRGFILRIMRQVAVILLVVGLLGTTLYGQLTEEATYNENYGDSGEDATGASKGDNAPPIELTDNRGERVALDDYLGREVVISFWTTWCGVCKTEMPHMQRLYDEYRSEDDGAVLLSVNVTSQDAGEAAVHDYMEKYGYTFPVALDKEGEIFEAYQVKAYPTTYIIDRNGVIRERFVGAISYEDMKERVGRVRTLSGV